jgi:transcriptional regulator GlxA family with amidase domain
MPKQVGILVFDEVEELDFTGPLEVFGVASRIKSNTFDIFTVGRNRKEIRGRNKLVIKPDFSFMNCPKIDVLVVPGGKGARVEMERKDTLEFMRKTAKNCELVTSVCTGALILAGAGLLAGKKATTHWASLDELRAFEGVSVQHRRYIRQGNLITAAGISAGIDMALFVVGRLFGPALRRDTMKHMEYY